uniref:Cytochrome b5 reductase 4 n=1 Tax=Leptobrachium leishanense TaxID=445787 RepID=A0A8C5QFS6_9ANUR
MLNVPSTSFPAPSSQQRVATIGRSKVPLKPGRSLMDWIRLTKSGKDLTGLRGRLIDVTEEELAKHNKKNDCWMCIRGMVYNVSHYMEFHPGGEEELMRAAGADGTELFDQTHRWVNYDSMLKECLIGRIAVKPVSILKDRTTGVKEKNCLNGTMAPDNAAEVTEKEFRPRYDWFQTDALVTIVIYTQQKDMSLEFVTVDHEENILRAEVIIGDFSYLLLIELNHEVHMEINVHAKEKAGKIEVVLQKKHPVAWKTLGRYLEGHDSFIKSSQRGHHYRKCKLVSKNDISYNTRLLCFELPQGSPLHVPVGHHVYLKLSISGTQIPTKIHQQLWNLCTYQLCESLLLKVIQDHGELYCVEVVKPYTPVSPFLILDPQKTACGQSQFIYFMIKIYSDGSFSPRIDQLKIGDYVLMSNPQGNFPLSQIETVEDFFFLAAGTGLTPMVNLLNHIFKRHSILRKAKLFFFNRTEDDILWRDQLIQLNLADERFEAQFILSEPTDKWDGYKGRISLTLLSERILKSDQKNVLICICGPNGFVDEGIRFCLHR